MAGLTPTVSVLLPIRQWRSHTAAAIESILTQTLTDFELLIIGPSAIDSLAPRLPPDPRIRLLARPRPGIVAALNAGIAQARGQYLARMDDDDIARPQRLQQQLDHLRSRSGTDLCGACIRFIDSAGGSSGIRRGNRDYQHWLNGLRTHQALHEAAFIECVLPHPTWMAHRELWQRLGPYSQDDLPEDFDMLLRARLLGMRLGKPDAILLDWREHDQRLTWHDERYRRDAFARCRARALTDPRCVPGVAHGRPVWLCGTGRNARRWHDALVSCGATVAGFVDVHRHGPQRSKRELPVIGYETLASIRGDALVIAAVAGNTARQKLQAWFTAQGWQSDRDFLLGA